MPNSLKEITHYLFSCDFFDDNFDPEGHEVHLEKAHKLQETYPWIDIINDWHNYLYCNCSTPDKVINFANLFFYYEGVDGYNPNPYRFLGYLYSVVDMDIYWDEAGDLFDSIAINILYHQQLINLNENPYYNPLKDPKIISEINYWKSK